MRPNYKLALVLAAASILGTEAKAAPVMGHPDQVDHKLVPIGNYQEDKKDTSMGLPAHSFYENYRAPINTGGLIIGLVGLNAIFGEVKKRYCQKKFGI